jgi:hypothetical protein
MKKKVRILRDLPFNPQGSVVDIEWDTPIGAIYSVCYLGWMELGLMEFETLLSDKWIEYVEEEKSLEEKLLRGFNQQSNSATHEHRAINSSVIAHTHYKEKFDKVIEKYESDMRMCYTDIRKALFGEDK